MSAVHFSKILPVLFMEYLAVSIARTLFPAMLVEAFGKYSYLAVGIMETVKGLLAFVSSPLFGKLSDKIGRKFCLLATVLGTTMPVCIMVFTSNMYVYAFAMSVSGFFSATFALTFAYISDCVSDKKRRAPAFGLALATFGLSFCIGPVIGSYLADVFGAKVVFMLSSILVVMNLVYMIFFLPETVKDTSDAGNFKANYEKFGVAMEYLPNSWNFKETFRIFNADDFMFNVAVVVFIYYTSVWAMVSTLMVYITHRLQFSTVTLGWLLSSYGLATMFSEAILVRIIVPRLGETNSMRLGLLAFSIQCVIVAFSTTPEWIFVSVLFSMLATLVYPSVSSLVSKIVSEDAQGEALGALNGIKALTEGFGPLLFGLFMALFEETQTPGAPYLMAALLSCWAFLHCFELPPEPEVLVAKHEGRRKKKGEAQSLLDASDTDDERM